MTSEILLLREEKTSLTTDITILRQEKISMNSETLLLRQEKTSLTTDTMTLRQDKISMAEDISILREATASLNFEIASLYIEAGEVDKLKSQVDDLQKRNEYYMSETIRLGAESHQRESKALQDGVPG